MSLSRVERAGRPFSRKVGLKRFPRWFGVRKDGDPASLLPVQFRVLENARVRGDDVTARGGQSTTFGGVVTGCPTGIFPPEFQLGATPGVIFSHPAPSGDPLAGELFDLTNNTVTVVDLDSGNTMSFDFALKFGTQTILGTRESDDKGRLRVLHDLTNTPDVLVTLPSPAVGVHSMAVFNNVLYVGAYDISSNPLIYGWDGASISLEVDLTSTETGRPVLGTDGTRLLAGINNKIYKYVSAGVWSSVMMPSGVNNFRTQCYASFSGALWVGGFNATATFPPGMILKWDGTTMTKEREIPAVLSAIPIRVGGLTVYNSKLYYGYAEQAASSGKERIGNYDGATWDDDHKDIAAQFFPLKQSLAISSLFSFSDGNLWTIFSWRDQDTNLSQFQFARSPGTDTAGTWVNKFGPILYQVVALPEQEPVTF